MPPLSYRYRHHGLRVASFVALPELECRRLPDGTECDVSIDSGPLGDVGEQWRGAAGLRGANGCALFSYSNLGRFLVRGGTEVTADLLAEADPALVRSCLLTAVIAMLCHQRGLMVLHASAVAFDGNAIAFAGVSGAGKSTLAAHCVEAGARLLADDILVASFAENGTVLAHPGTSLLKLKTYALQSLGRTSRGLVQENPEEDKYLLPVAGNLADEPVPLRRVHVLAEEEGAGHGRCVPLTGRAALSALVENSFAGQYLDVIGGRPRHFADCCRLAERVEIVLLSRRRDASYLPVTAALVGDMAGPTGGGHDDRRKHHRDAG